MRRSQRAFDGMLASAIGHFGNGAALVPVILWAREVGEPHFVPGLCPGSDLLAEPLAAFMGAKDSLEAFGAAVVSPVRKGDEDTGAAVDVGIAVEGDVAAVLAGVLHEPDEAAAAAGAGRLLVEVGDVDGDAAAIADLDGLSEGIEVAVPHLVADVGVVDAAQARRPGMRARRAPGCPRSCRGGSPARWKGQRRPPPWPP